MRFLPEYIAAVRAEEVARLRRLLALRALKESGVVQRKIAVALDISQPAVSQQLAAASTLSSAPVELLREAATSLLESVADPADRESLRFLVERIVGVPLEAEVAHW